MVGREACGRENRLFPWRSARHWVCRSSKSCAVLAPMSGITDPQPFRRLAERLGAGLVVSEMTACAGLARGEREADRPQRGFWGGGCTWCQLAGCEPQWMAEGARIAEAQGAEYIIDINMGCPSKQVTNGAAGSALMRDLDHALSLIETTVSAVRVPVTLKMSWLGPIHRQRTRACTARRSRRHQIDYSSRLHRCSFLTGEPTGARCEESNNCRDSRRCKW